MNTCKDAIHCRPWVTPHPPIVYFYQTDFKYIYLFGILRTNEFMWSAFEF